MIDEKDKILFSQNLHMEWVKERKRDGLKEMPSINNGSRNQYRKFSWRGQLVE